MAEFFSIQKPLYKVQLRVHEGINLDGSAAGDSFVMIKCGGEKEFRTKAVKKREKPIWNESFDYFIFNDRELDELVFIFEVSNKQRIKNRFVGTCKFEGKELKSQVGHTVEKTLPLLKKKFKGKAKKGEIRVSFKLVKTDPRFIIPAMGVDEFEKNAAEFLIKCFGYLYDKDGFNTEGLFRKGGSHKKVLHYKSELYGGKKIYLSEIDDIHVVCSLIKNFVTNLEEPLFTYRYYSKLIDVVKNTTDESTRVTLLKSLIFRLKERQLRIIVPLFYFLFQISKRCTSNKMDATNLSIVFAPNVLKCNDTVIQFQNYGSAGEVVKLVIKHFDSIFGSERGKGVDERLKMRLPFIKRLLKHTVDELKDLEIVFGDNITHSQYLSLRQQDPQKKKKKSNDEDDHSSMHNMSISRLLVENVEDMEEILKGIGRVELKDITLQQLTNTQKRMEKCIDMIRSCIIQKKK